LKEDDDGANLYRSVARYYDLDDRSIAKDDIPFYLACAAKAKGDVLELACGTGRVTVPLADAGHNVCGIDLSEEMLFQLRAKLTKLPAYLGRRITLVNGDMSAFSLEREFQLIIIPFRSFQLLTGEPKPISCLNAVRQHLSAKGRFIVHLFRPWERMDDSWVRPETTDWEGVDSKTGCRIHRANANRRIDLETQTMWADQVYFVTKPDGIEERVTNSLVLKYYYPDQIRRLLKLAGFDILEEMGYFDGRPLDRGPEMIFVCAKVDR
jgi:SAM-dependent methyltransferase